MTTKEQSLVMIKPDAVKRLLIGQIIQRFENKGLTISNIKMATLTPELVAEHYPHLVEKTFFHEISDFMTSGPSVFMIVEGDNVVEIIRTMIGVTNIVDAAPGTVRGDFGNAAVYHENVIHASDSVTSAQEEIKRFFN
ncbi:nucleoside-diphosphate kinase [Vagococcus xieshaowenii]|uniref:Nucleoside diphosphate kinase n=1 Tax=Vagococcus xieshaowenii TaxID=2562451 RepID=A0A4Z0DD83_9ENTE|nr:nucleoside-diphosphate kinase [Vagococcus xieshaowenii]QCA28454.1 nucleoside-diphosphate kinase [Vagococcus xieshaowenii]TFZ42791.1 nucleoside-diphosphate kinase [Vagococcus xieshaowenii]